MKIDSPWPYFDDEQVQAVSDVLLSGKVNYWTGEHGRMFEQEYANYVGCMHAIAVTNGTVALELALKALDIGVGDEVITTSRTFIASASCIVVRGATPVFADIDEDSQNIKVENIKKCITPQTKAIIAVHLAGWPCEMDAIMSLAEENDIKVIEDCAQAHGARYKGRPVGSIGHVAAFSFCQDKIMSTGGEGGMVTTDDYDLWAKMWAYKDHGKSWHAVNKKQHPPGFKWLHDSFGTNWRMTEMQAAIGRVQLRKMPEWHKDRRNNAEKIWATAEGIKALRVPEIPEYIEHAAYKCYVFIEKEMLRQDWSRDRVMSEINEHGVPCYSGSCSEVYLEKAFDNTQLRPSDSLPVAKKLGETSLMFLVHPTLSDKEITQTCQVIRHVMKSASLN